MKLKKGLEKEFSERFFKTVYSFLLFNELTNFLYISCESWWLSTLIYKKNRNMQLYWHEKS